jgi:hypothetical protein
LASGPLEESNPASRIPITTPLSDQGWTLALSNDSLFDLATLAQTL